VTPVYGNYFYVNLQYKIDKQFAADAHTASRLVEMFCE